MSELAILVPVLRRPHRVAPLLVSIQRATPAARVIFIADPDDEGECAAIRRARRETSLQVEALTLAGNYAAKINYGVRETGEPLIFLGADDLEFAPGWLELARGYLGEMTQVVGVNDLCSQRVQAGNHATHFLMTREYAMRPLADGKPGPLCEVYDHSFTDDELVATARRRGAIHIATDVIVRHLHPDAGTAEMDDTYRKGRAKIRQDRRIYRSRRPLWT